MTAFSLSSLTISGSTLLALRGITQSLVQSNTSTFTATASALAPQPAVNSATSSIVDRIRTQIQQSQVQQQALAQATGVVNAALKGATQVASALTQLRALVAAASQPGATTDQLQSLAQQFNAGLSSLSSSIQGSAFGGVNLLNGSNVQQFQASGLSAGDLQGLNFQTGVVASLTVNSLQSALNGGGNPFADLTTRIENAVSTDVGQASPTVIASFTNQFISQAGGTSNQSQVFALGNTLIAALNGQSQPQFDQQTQRLVGRILDSIGDGVPQTQTTALVNQLITSLQNAPSSVPATNLKGADFAGANLQGVNFAGVDLTGANFEGANLQGANFTGAILDGTNFEHANLQGANLQTASIQGAYFKGANLQGTIYQNSPPPPVPEPFIPEPPPPTGQNFERQNLTGGSFAGQNLQSADFERSRVQNADFAGTNLAGASFERANAQGANFGGADLARADFAGANLQGANFQAPPGSGGSGNGGTGGGGSGAPNFDTVLSAVDQAIATVANGIDVLNREAQSIKDQTKSASDVTSTLNKEIGGLVNTNLTTETAKVSALQIAVNLGLQSISITGTRARGLLQTLLTGEPSGALPTSGRHEPVSSTTTEIPSASDATNNGSGTFSRSSSSTTRSTTNTTLLPPISPVPSSLLSTALNIQA